MQKNVAGQKWIVFAFDETDNTAKTGDAAQITAEISADGAAGGGNITDTNPTELEDGYYAFDITQGESNADLLLILPESSTGNIQVIGVPGAIYTTEPNRNKLSVDSNGRADIIKIAGTTQTANDNGADINAILTDTSELQTDWANGGRLDLLVDAIKVVTDNLAAAAATMVTGTVAATAGNTTTIYSDDITEATADHFNGRIIIFTSGDMISQATDITDYVLEGGEGKFTVTATTEIAAENDTFVIV